MGRPGRVDGTAPRGCAEFTRWPIAKTEAVIAAVKSLETLPDVAKLTAALTA